MRWDSLWIVFCLLALNPIWVSRSEELPPPASSSETVTLARIHFAGDPSKTSDTVRASTNSASGSISISQQLTQQTLDKLARAPFAFCRQRAAPGSRDFAPLLRPIFEDLAKSEWYLEVSATTTTTATTGATGLTPEVSFAINLTPERARIWQSNLATVASSWTKVPAVPIKDPGFEGWELKKHHLPNLWRLARTSSWLVIGIGQDRLPLHSATLEKIRKFNRPIDAPEGFRMDAMIDGPRLEPWLSLVTDIALPRVNLKLLDSGECWTAQGDFLFPSALNWEPVAWEPPTNIIGGPLMSFAALQCATPWLERIRQLQPFRWEPPPKQFYLWTSADNPMQTSLAIPVSGAATILERIAPTLASAFNTNLLRFAAGDIAWRAKDKELVWERVPFISPTAYPLQDSGREYIVAGLTRPVIRPAPGTTHNVTSQNAGSGDPAYNNPVGRAPSRGETSDVLYNSALGKFNLGKQVYFGWENTSPNLARWRTLSLLLLPIARRPLMNSDSLGNRWLDAMTPKLAETTTRLELKSPTELRFVRQGTLALTGLELVLLANWLETTNFPLCGLELPARAERTTGGR